MADNDILSKHAERQQVPLSRAAISTPVVGLLLDASRPAQAKTYGGNVGGGDGRTTATDLTTTTTVPTSATFKQPSFTLATARPSRP